jgi:hypothetical protein
LEGILKGLMVVQSLVTWNLNSPSCSIPHEAITHFQLETLNIYALENPHLQSVINYKPNRDGGRSENFGGQESMWGYDHIMI